MSELLVVNRSVRDRTNVVPMQTGMQMHRDVTVIGNVADLVAGVPPIGRYHPELNGKIRTSRRGVPRNAWHIPRRTAGSNEDTIYS